VCRTSSKPESAYAGIVDAGRLNNCSGLKKIGTASGEFPVREPRESFEKLTFLAVGVTVRKLQLVQVREGSQLKVEHVFSGKEVEVLRVLLTTLEGRTEQQKNRHGSSLLAWRAVKIRKI
jgi:hypothetical protein